MLAENPERVRELAKARQKKFLKGLDPQVRRARERAWNLKRNYGITVAQYDAMFTAQGGVCAICAESVEGSLHVDHDHTTDAVRGLLCGNCNTAIGLFQEDAARMAAGAAYLERYRA
jgi:Recombination endonuclease VII